MRKTLLTGIFAMMLILGASWATAQPQDQGGGPGGRFDPAQMMERRLDNIKETLKATDEEWTALKPLVEGVVKAQAGGMMGGMGGRGMMGMGGRGRRRGGQDNQDNPDRAAQMEQFRARMMERMAQEFPERAALMKAVESNTATPEELKAKLATYREALKKRQEAVKAAQEKLRGVVTVKQEAQLVVDGILD